METITNGYPLFIIPLIIIFIITIILLIKSIKNNTQKNRELVKQISLFALVFGFGCLFQELFWIFEMVAIATDSSAGVLAVGFKYSITPTIIGMTIFLIARLGIIGLIIKEK
ncbi:MULTISPECIES: hypothetical protein [Polaribacter]|uniref:MotA/TolQ/ExbB proton channel domain-containing protein n=1 Tax=Polaribacter sejongensis TaxID=985043 RepID=A0ABM6PYN4_9FLAO|nr:MULTISPECIES: hypothetical protein [Polaribacter]AUC21999.1 hypothetical protein BTO15_07750 [Polaribacter sejongensis]